VFLNFVIDKFDTQQNQGPWFVPTTTTTRVGNQQEQGSNGAFQSRAIFQ
jgi:hypothetical protein